MSRTLQPPVPFRRRMALGVSVDEATGAIVGSGPGPRPWSTKRDSFPTVERVRTVRGFGSFTGLYRLSGLADVVLHHLVQEGPRSLDAPGERKGPVKTGVGGRRA